MLARKHRFHGRASLGYVHRQGQTARGPFFLVKAAANPRRQDYRAAIVVSRKVHKSAVARNRMRRRLYAALRQQQINKAYDIVLTVVDGQVAELPPKDLAHQLKKQLTAAGVL